MSSSDRARARILLSALHGEICDALGRSQNKCATNIARSFKRFSELHLTAIFMH